MPFVKKAGFFTHPRQNRGPGASGMWIEPAFMQPAVERAHRLSLRICLAEKCFEASSQEVDLYELAGVRPFPAGLNDPVQLLS